ncbi:asparagine synthase-related protein [Escherichia coli]
MEARVPFPDKKFLDVAMRINPQDKMCGNGKMEKHILRECFRFIPACKRGLAAEGAVLRWRRLQLDRHPERSGGAAGF